MQLLDDLVKQRLSNKLAWRRREAQWGQFHRWEGRHLRQSAVTPRQACRWFDALLREANVVRALRRRGGLDELDAVLRLAAIVNRPVRHA